MTHVAVESSGVTLETPHGSMRAKVVIGADGVGSIVRRTLGLAAGSLTAQVVELAPSMSTAIPSAICCTSISAIGA